MDKKALRAEIRAQKRAMTEQQIAKTSEALAQQLYAHPAWQNAKSIFGYLSYNQEVGAGAEAGQAGGGAQGHR